MAFVEVGRFHDPLGAELARARLVAAGIEAVLLDAGISAVTGGALQPARLIVPERDAHDAAALLADARG